ncbi:S41 family peptidase [Chryseobacterium indoltheticum]|uniref:Peptidase family S41 n=1 Tax=Chryseobacterium indoltheticum TaxID=254 RepID=A0A381FQD8_9FLAO|nr:S41 family peptidase [Chryseobacterium indoltheticum]SUX48770.1 Peptidase family S41 [Chryseobacterium indoltheticum]
MQTENAFIHKLSKKTLLMRIPSFSGSQRMIIDSMLTFNKDLINKTDNLIIDLRNNGGGDDSSYSPLIPLLYTNPIRITTVEFLSTPLNNKRMEDYLLNPDLSEKSKRQINEQLILLKSNLGKFVNLNNGQTTVVQRLDKVTVHPKMWPSS